MSFSQGIAICTYNRGAKLEEVIAAVEKTKPGGSRIVVCDDGSTDNTADIVRKFPEVTYIRGPNMGVGANKNRALFSLRACDFICILEDDLMPLQKEWFELYREFCLGTNIHHFCRVQDKQVPETVPDFTAYCVARLNMTPIFGSSPRGDLTFISNLVIRKVGAIHPGFVGVGHAHGQWSDRVAASGLIPHPLRWVDVKEANEKFIQIGDTEGGRWNVPDDIIKEQIRKNAELRKILGVTPEYVEPFLP